MAVGGLGLLLSPIACGDGEASHRGAVVGDSGGAAAGSGAAGSPAAEGNGGVAGSSGARDGGGAAGAGWAGAGGGAGDGGGGAAGGGMRDGRGGASSGGVAGDGLAGDGRGGASGGGAAGEGQAGERGGAGDDAGAGGGGVAGERGASDDGGAGVSSGGRDSDGGAGSVGAGGNAGGGSAGKGGTAAGGTVGPGEDCRACEEAEARLGGRACVCRVPDRELWASITVPTGVPFELRATKFTLPARDDARLPALFMDASAFRLHYDFLRESFPDRFGSLETWEYLALIEDPEQREFYAGTITEYALGGQVVLYGFTLWDDPADAATTITCEQARAAYATIDERFELLPLAFVPSTANQRELLPSCDIPTYDADRGLDYEAYTEGVGYGTLRRYTLAEFGEATEEQAFGWQDILVLEEAPTDIEVVISGAVTGTQQGALSHLNVRSAARGTPNCYIENAYDLFAPWEGELVRLECGSGFFAVEPATAEEASAFWATLRPPSLTVPLPDREASAFADLLDVPTGTPEERATALMRYGAKGANLATLYQRINQSGDGGIDENIELPGFLVPMRHYLDFFESRAWTVDLGSGPEERTFAETVDAWLDDDVFRSDGGVRRQRLESLRDAMEDAPVDLDLSSPIRDIFGTDTLMLRFRSSSNAEDALEFSGAGLYDSVSGCLADDLDGDEVGPSRCDATQDDERTVSRALRKVWASLWNAAAYSEREWYGIEQTSVAMGVLVDPRIQNELANIVAFSGNPTSSEDDRYLINAQAGELDVVTSEPGVFPEEELLTLVDGAVTSIERQRGSSELPAGTWVLQDAELEQIGSLLWQIVEFFPVDATVPEGATVLLDTEWKVRSDGSLVVKQVRPFLRK